MRPPPPPTALHRATLPTRSLASVCASLAALLLCHTQAPASEYFVEDEITCGIF